MRQGQLEAAQSMLRFSGAQICLVLRQRAGQGCEAEQKGQGRAEQSGGGEGRIWQGMIGQGRAGQGRAGQGSAAQARTRWGRAVENMQGLGKEAQWTGLCNAAAG